MAKAKQLPSGSWRVRVYVGKNADGKAVYESITRLTRKEAEYAALEMALHHKEVMRDSAAVTLREAADQYIADREFTASPATITGYRRIVKNYFQPIIDMPLKKITQKHIQREIDNMAMHLSAKTITNAHGLLVAIFREYHPDFNFHTKLPKKIKYIPHIPNHTEIPQILNAVKDTPISIPVYLAIWLGLRMSEIRALRFKNVYDDYIIIDTAIVDGDCKAYEKDTKSYAGTRMIPAPQELIDMIRSQPHESENDFVTSLSGQAIYKRFVATLKKNNIPPMRFHDLRHANASIMLMLNVPDKYAMERLGHATNSTLKNIYQHTMSAEKAEIAHRINSYFKSITQTNDT